MHKFILFQEPQQYNRTSQIFDSPLHNHKLTNKQIVFVVSRTSRPSEPTHSKLVKIGLSFSKIHSQGKRETTKLDKHFKFDNHPPPPQGKKYHKL